MQAKLHCVNNMLMNLSYLRLSPVVLAAFRSNVLHRLVSLKFSKETLGRLESRKRECGMNTTYGELSYERGIITLKAPREFYRAQACSFSADWFPVFITS